MISVFSEADAQIVVAGIAAVAAIAAAIVSARAKRSNTVEHGEVVARLDTLVRKVDDLAGDMHDVKADVRDLKAADRDASDRIHALEHPQVPPA